MGIINIKKYKKGVNKLTNDKDDIKKFLDKLDDIILDMENHPKLSNYFIGVVDQLKNFSIAIKTDNNISYND